MKKRNWKRIVLTITSVFVFLVIVLAVHIYIVTRKPHADANTRVMARIDIRQGISQEDADKITAWLYQQKGIDHVLVNPKSAIAIFTYAPMKNDASLILADFRRNLPYKAERFMPPSSKGACPAGF